MQAKPKTERGPVEKALPNKKSSRTLQLLAASHQMQLPAQLEAVEPPAKPSKPTVIKCCFKSQYFGVVGYTEVDAKTETDFDSKIV